MPAAPPAVSGLVIELNMFASPSVSKQEKNPGDKVNPKVQETEQRCTGGRLKHDDLTYQGT